MEIERALQQLELLQKKLYAYHCADSSLYRGDSQQLSEQG